MEPGSEIGHRGRGVVIRVRGSVPAGAVDRWDVDVAQAPPHTVLRGAVADRSALHGMLERIRAGGLEVVDVRPVPPQRRGQVPGT